MAPSANGWRDIAITQAGVITREQLAAVGVRPWAVAHRIATERWQKLSSTVVCTTTGPLSAEQRAWFAVLHGGTGALLGGLSAAAAAGLKKWDRDKVTVVVPYNSEVPPAVDGVIYVRSRRNLARMTSASSGVPRLILEPAILMFAASTDSDRTAQGVLAAAVQQRRTTPTDLIHWLDELKPLRRSKLLRDALREMAGGAQSLAEIDITRLCRTFRLRQPDRQIKRRDSEGRVRFTDCEWRLPDGRTLILEIDGLFHMDVDSWEDDLARQRALSAPDRTIVRCTSREVRDDPERIARDLRALGVPPAVAS